MTDYTLYRHTTTSRERSDSPDITTASLSAPATLRFPSKATTMPSLLDLPPELRLHIYSYVWDTSTPNTPSTRRRFPWPGLLRTCRQIRAEASPDFYGSVDWKFSLTEDTSTRGGDLDPSELLLFLRRLGPMVRHSRHLTISFRFGRFHEITVDLNGPVAEVSVWRWGGVNEADKDLWLRIRNTVRETVEDHMLDYGGKKSGISLSLAGWEEVVDWLDWYQWDWQKKWEARMGWSFHRGW